MLLSHAFSHWNGKDVNVTALLPLSALTAVRMTAVNADSVNKVVVRMRFHFSDVYEIQCCKEWFSFFFMPAVAYYVKSNVFIDTLQGTIY